MKSWQIRRNCKLISLSVFLLFLTDSCKRKNIEETGVPVKAVVPGLDGEKLTKRLLSKVKDTLYKPAGIYDDRFGDTLKEFYIRRKGNPVWINSLKDTQFRNNLFRLIYEMPDHGLDSGFYNSSLIRSYFTQFDSLKEIYSDQSYDMLSDLDYTLSITAIGLFKDLTLGRIDPQKYYAPFYDIEPSKKDRFRIFNVLFNPLTFHDTIHLYMPATRRYHALQTILKKQKQYISSNKVQDYDTGQKIHSSLNQKVISQRIELLWFSIEDLNADYASHKSWNEKEKVNKTRNMLGLRNGGVDSLLVDRLCVPSNEILNEAQVSLERERWYSQPDEGAYLMVSLTDFVVYMYNDTVKSMRVCVGKRKPADYEEKLQKYYKTKIASARPIDSETPQIGSAINQIILNPTWTVPNSIIGKEMYWNIVSKPGYLESKGYEVLKDGKVVPSGSINWRKYSPYKVPVKIRQKSGKANSLGLVKFNLPNRHNIYLHDTPEKSRFGYINRAVSHGCIRLNYPFEMAEFILGLQEDSTLVDKFRLKMGLQPYDTTLQVADSLLKPSKETERIYLKRKVPVYLVYKTVMIETDGHLRFNKDIYRKNRSLAIRLRK
ncbi:MAG: L,D-transpeptidase family protein [Flavobacteriales bacterium]|nr:L,D-transpeptidase family protein [Flavobacteriales bacterium]